MNLYDVALTVEIFPEDVKFSTRRVGKGDKQFDLRQQSAYYRVPGRKFPIFFQLALREDQPDAYAAGLYFIHPCSFQSGDYDSLEMSRFNFRLMPVPEDILEALEAPPVGAAPGGQPVKAAPAAGAGK